MRDFLAFLGIEPVEFVYAEGLARGEQPRVNARGAAAASIAALTVGSVAQAA